MLRDNFAVMILTHGRADRVYTLKSLEKCGYRGKWYIVIDNEDEQEQKYREKYGDRVLTFDKLAISKEFDTADLEQDRRTIVYARNACFKLAEEIGVRYFLELDDDYTDFQFRYEEDGKLKIKSVNDLNRLFEDMLCFLDASGARTVALAQGGDFIGGKDNARLKERVLRKAMNTFFCDTHKRFTFVGRINEDVNTYCTLGQRGELLFTVCDAMITQKTTQKNKGGMSDVYLDKGTYLKSFYTVMFCPSAVKIATMGDKHKRIHHRVYWENCTPKIINERYKKNSYGENGASENHNRQGRF